jgi:hypothetical protein
VTLFGSNFVGDGAYIFLGGGKKNPFGTARSSRGMENKLALKRIHSLSEDKWIVRTSVLGDKGAIIKLILKGNKRKSVLKEATIQSGVPPKEK